MVDGFHFKGHSNCSHGYNSKKLGFLDGIDTSLQEQKNSKLAKLKVQTLYMRFDNFTTLIRALTTRMNYKELNKGV